MKVVYLKKFSKDLDKVSQSKDLRAISDVIQSIKEAHSLEDISGVKKLTGFNDAFRIRSGNFRIGIFLDGKVVQFAELHIERTSTKYSHSHSSHI